MPSSPAYFRPTSVAEATALLRAHGAESRPLAGGTALTIMLRQRLIAPTALVDLTRLPGLGEIESVDDGLRIGALVTHREVERSALVRSRIPLLAETFAVVASVRVRCQATVGGVLAEADYASDPPATFVALDAVVEAEGPDGRREIPAAEFFQGFYETALAPDEIVTSVRIPSLPAGAFGVYEKFITRSSEDRPCLGAAAIVQLEPGTHRCGALRVAVGAVAEIPQRFPDVEAEAHGQVIDEALARQIAEQYAAAIDPLDDMRGSAWYRREMIRVWIRRAILRAHAGVARQAAA